jgi:hypothetical protein
MRCVGPTVRRRVSEGGAAIVQRNAPYGQRASAESAEIAAPRPFGGRPTSFRGAFGVGVSAIGVYRSVCRLV